MSDLGVTIFFLQLGILLILAGLFAELARRLRVPAVVGELSVGIILGPTVLKRSLPELQSTIFPSQGDAHTALATILGVGIVFFLFSAGMEVDLRRVFNSGRLALPISICGVLVPFGIAFLPAFLLPEFFGLPSGQNRVVAAMFIGACCSVTALPVLGRILLDLDLYKTAFGMLIMSAAVLDDFIGWMLVGTVLLLNQGTTAHEFGLQKIGLMIFETVLFVCVLMTMGRWFCSRVVALIYKISAESSRVICFVLATALLGACCTAAIGIHAPMGAFTSGVLIGASKIKEETKHAIEEFVKSLFAPVYFASVGLSVDFAANFDLRTILFVIVIACLGKIGGCFLAARVQKLPAPSSLGIALAMNTRGSIEIVLATIGLQAGIIDERMFVALTLMAVTTSCLTGWALRSMAETLKDDRALRPSV